MTDATVTREQAALAIFSAMMTGPGAKVSPHGDLGIAQKEIEVAFALADTFVKVADKQRGEQVPPPLVRETETLTWFDEHARRRVSTFPKGSLPPGMADGSLIKAFVSAARGEGRSLAVAIHAVIEEGGKLTAALTCGMAVEHGIETERRIFLDALLDLQTEWRRHLADEEIAARKGASS